MTYADGAGELTAKLLKLGLTQPEIRDLQGHKQRETESPLYAPTGIRARSSCNGEEAKAPAKKRMGWIDDFDIPWQGQVIISLGGTSKPEGLDWTRVHVPEIARPQAVQ